MNWFCCIVLCKNLLLFFYIWISTFPSSMFWRDSPFPILYSQHPCEDYMTACVGFFPLGFLSVPLVSISVFMLAQCSLIYCIFVIYFDLKSGVAAVRPPALFFQKAVLVLLLHIKFSIVFLFSPNATGIWAGVALNL